MGQPPKNKDPYFGLKYIAYCRTGIPVNEEDIDEESVLNFARWQICKTRNVLWNDPIWETYTPQEILIEFFSIRFDEDTKMRAEFEASIVSAKEEDVDWLERMEQRYLAEKNSKIDNELSTGKPPEATPPIQDEFEDSF